MLLSLCQGPFSRCLQTCGWNWCHSVKVCDGIFFIGEAVQKWAKWAIDWGFREYWKANAYAFRATEPDDMFAARDRGIDIVGPGNDIAIRTLVDRVRREGGRVLAGWGQHIDSERQRRIASLLQGVEVVCCAVNKNGTPAHPLYKKPATLPWTCP